MKTETKKANILSKKIIDRIINQKKNNGEILNNKKKSKANKPINLFSFFLKVISEEDYNSKINEQKVLKAWLKITGETISNHTKPEKVNDSILYIKTNNHTITKQIQISKKQIIHRIFNLTNIELKDIKTQKI